MKRIYRFLCSCILFLSSFFSRGNGEKRTYMTYDMTQICRSHQDRFKINMHHTGTGSTGILMASDYLAETEEHECMAVIRPPEGYGVVFNIEDVMLRRDHNMDCRDFIKIFNETSGSTKAKPVCQECCRFRQTTPFCHSLCGYESNGRICEEYCHNNTNTVHMGTGRSIAVLYNTGCGSCSSEKERIGFRIVFTAYKIHAERGACDWPLHFQCDNGRCIWGGLTCDGHNNCGDMSDESSTQCGYFPSPVKVVVVISAVCATVLVGVLIACLPRMSIAKLCQKHKVDLKLRAARLDLKCKQHQQRPNTKLKKPCNKTATSEDRLSDIHEHSVGEHEV